MNAIEIEMTKCGNVGCLLAQSALSSFYSDMRDADSSTNCTYLCGIRRVYSTDGMYCVSVSATLITSNILLLG